jgi:uncharacterized membrane protein
LLLKKLLSVLGVLAVSVIFSGAALAADAAKDEGGVGILGAAQQTGQLFNCPEGVTECEITCPVGVPNCTTSSTLFQDTSKNEAARYSAKGTQLFLLQLTGGLLTFAAVVAVIMLIVSAVPLVIAAGNQEKVQAAHKSIRWVLTGLVIIMLALFIVRNMTELVYQSIVGSTGETAPVTAPAPVSAIAPAATVTPAPAVIPGGSGSPAATPAPIKPTSTFCEKENAGWKLPPVCYTGDRAGTQTALPNAGECQGAATVWLGGLCTELNLSEGDCTIENIQKGLLGGGYYSGLPQACSKADTKYGECTKTAIENYCLTAEVQDGINKYNQTKLAIAPGAAGGVTLKSATKTGTTISVVCEYMSVTNTTSTAADSASSVGEACANQVQAKAGSGEAG